jgi:hypothetical protein
MKMIAISLVLAAIGLVLSRMFQTGGDVVWLAFVVFWAVVGFFKEWPLKVTVPCFLLCLSIIVAHTLGYKVYGEVPLYDNRPLVEHALELDKLEAPNLLVATDGSKHALRGVKIRPEILAQRGTNPLRHISHSGTTYRFRADPSKPSGYLMEHPIYYFCGNIFFARFFPRRQPMYKTSDAAKGLLFLVEPE